MRRYKFEKADFIIDNIYLGSENAAGDLNYLRQLNIDRVIIAAKLTKPQFEKELDYLVFHDLDDDPFADIRRYFAPALKFVLKRKSTNVLVHCVSGISRSVSIVIAYLIKEKAMTYAEAFAFVREKRSVAHPNTGFQRQLKEYERSLRVPRSASSRSLQVQKKS